MVRAMCVNPNNQKGVALIVTLVLLVVALLLGLSSFQSSRLDESMAGNQRASNLALMAAEHGASDFWLAVRDASVTGPGAPKDGEDVPGYTKRILDALADWANNSDPDQENGFDVESCLDVDADLRNVCYEINIVSIQTSGEDSEINSLFVTSTGKVFSGDMDASGIPLEVLARRQVGMNFSAMLGESLSAINFAGDLFELDGISSQATIEGEEVDGYVNPAISVRSRAEAEKIVREILGNNSSFFDRDAIFIPDDPDAFREDGIYGSNVEGVYHHIDVVDFSEAPPVYVGNYDGCKKGSTRLCNYKGGVASKLGTPILSNPEMFDQFIGLLADQTETIRGNAAEVITNASTVGGGEEGKVFFVTNQDGSEYFRPVFDEANIREKEKQQDPDDIRLERDVFDLGGFDHKGILVVDGDVEFSGNPQFEGLIIVLGDYSVGGGGGDPFVGAVISAPYSINFEDDSGKVSPDRISLSGEFINSDGDVIASSDSKVVMHSATTEGFLDDGKSATLDDYPVLVDENGDLVYLTAEIDGKVVFVDEEGSKVDSENKVLATPYFGGIDGKNLNLKKKRVFDPSGFSVSGGGKLDYRFDYDVIEAAFDLMDDETLLSWLIGQARLDGSFEYGLSSWREIVLPQ